MSIPESQLETWCNQGATETSADAYTSIKAALAAPSSPIRDKTTEIYLQGSYGNTTNIYADSDVDVVVQLNSIWGRDLSDLSSEQAQLYAQTYPSATYNWKQFYADVVSALQKYYGTAAVRLGHKAIKVTVPSNRTVDVVPALHYRKYQYFFGDEHQAYVSGIKFEDRSCRIIINYPKEHIKNGEAKNSTIRTNRTYKQAIRMFKNARNVAIDRNLIGLDVAPSYFVECFLYNVPDNLFSASRQTTYTSVYDYLWSKIPMDTATCQNEQTLLFGSTPVQWDKGRAALFVNGMALLWNNW